jgi:hypothetical protein
MAALRVAIFLAGNLLPYETKGPITNFGITNQYRLKKLLWFQRFFNSNQLSPGSNSKQPFMIGG